MFNSRRPGRGLALFSLASVAMLAAATAARAGTILDFEDGTLSGWQSSTVPGGSGSAGVSSHNGSQMAYVTHSSAGQDAISHDFSYSASDPLSFDMQAVSVAGASIGSYANIYIPSQSGVVISFLNFLNASLGQVAIINATDSGSLGAGAIGVDTSQHNYSGAMSDFAAAAGLDPLDSSIKKLSLRFFTTGNPGTIAPSSSTVWVDNVSVGAVPEPAAAGLMGLGVLPLLLRRRRLTQLPR